MQFWFFTIIAFALLSGCAGLDPSRCNSDLDGMTTDEAKAAVGAFTGGGMRSCFFFAADHEADTACVCRIDSDDLVYSCDIESVSEPSAVMYWACM